MKDYLKALECLESLDFQTRSIGILDISSWKKYLPIIKQALIKAQEQEKVLEIIKEHFIINFKEDDIKGVIWARFVSIQAKEDEGEWDCTACANLVDYKEEFELLKEYFK